MENKTDFSRRLKLFDGLTWLTLNSIFYDRSTPLRPPPPQLRVLWGPTGRWL